MQHTHVSASIYRALTAGEQSYAAWCTRGLVQGRCQLRSASTSSRLACMHHAISGQADKPKQHYRQHCPQLAFAVELRPFTHPPLPMESSTSTLGLAPLPSICTSPRISHPQPGARASRAAFRPSQLTDWQASQHSTNVSKGPLGGNTVSPTCG